jgi:outer membrane receptor protein involved in Fe transport
LDFFISQRLNRTWRIRFSARNLLDPEFERLVGKRSDYNGEFVFSRFTRGITFGLSLTAEF